MDPGAIAGVLARIDRHALDGHELAVLLRAEARAQAWLQAGMAQSMVELSHSPDSPTLRTDGARGSAERTTRPNRFAAEEIALALGISPGSASWQLRRARFACQQMPAAWQAWRDGHLSQAKAWACHDELADCDDQVAAEFVRRFFDEQSEGRDGLTPAERAAHETAGEFRQRARRLVQRLDAGAAARRRDRRVRGRRVCARHDGDGVGYLSGTDLPAESIAAAYEHVDALARARKNGGDERTLDALRADVFAELLSGDHGEPDDLFGDAEPDGPHDGEPEPNGPHDSDPESDAPAASGPTAGGGRRVNVRPVHVVVPFDLLAGGDTPGEVVGFGVLPAESVRRLLDATRRRRSTWAITVVDPQSGRPVAHVRRNFRPGARRRPGAGRLVELVVPRRALGLPVDEFDPRGLVPRALLRRLLEQAGSAPRDWCKQSHRRSAHDATAPQQRFVRARDRRCCFPGCRRRAVACDIDHKVPHEQGGQTCPCNLHCLCRRHHQTKQQPGWMLVADRVTGNTRWHSPHGCQAFNDTFRLDSQLYERPSGGYDPGAVCFPV